jgi:acetyl esterase/lipase
MHIRVFYTLIISTFSVLNAFAGSVQEQSITFKSDDSITLAGTVTRPSGQNGSKKIPAVLLIAGSGPTDRDGNQPPSIMTDVLKKIAHELASHGIASFRFDKRATHSNQLQWPTDAKLIPKFFSWQNHQADVRAAFASMRNSKGIDSRRVAILGHSEGGILAVSQAKLLSPKALILIGTPGRTFGEVLTEQISMLLEKQGASASIKGDYLTKVTAIQKFISENGQIPPDVPPGLKVLYPQSASLFLRDTLNLDPTTLVKKYPGPVLVLNGEFDSQVSPSRDAAMLFSTLQTRKSSVQTLLIVPSASHNLKKVNGPLDAGLTGPVDSSALAELKTWLSKNL